MTPEEAKRKIRRYCAYQERSHLEVRNKLYEYGMRSSAVDEILTDLITDNFLNEERFAKAYAGGKFRMKKWGRTRIVHALEAKGISPNCIKIGLREIDEDAYRSTLQKLLQEKLESEEADDPFAIRNQLANLGIRKGYEPDLVWTMVYELLPKT